MYVLSFDIGIKNLAYCLFEINNTVSIKDWGVLNLTGNINHVCHCSKKAYFYKETKFFCKKHCPPLSTKEDMINLCKLHSMDIPTSLPKLKKIVSPYIVQPISMKKASQCSPVFLGKQLIEQFRQFTVPIHTVLIENQIGPLANRMKALQGMVIQYWLMQQSYVECISASNKLKLFITEKTTYAERKRLSIEYTRQLLENNKLETTFERHTKKDDLADSFLQGIWYFQNQKNNLNADYLKLSILI
jgi:hypothetical protein